MISLVFSVNNEVFRKVFKEGKNKQGCHGLIYSQVLDILLRRPFFQKHLGKILLRNMVQ